MIEQIVIGLCGIATVWLSQDSRRSYARWACIIGLCAQPFWFYATWNAGQWGILGLTVVYAIGWARGIRTYWLKPRD